jgi:hypothetical protein
VNQPQSQSFPKVIKTHNVKEEEASSGQKPKVETENAQHTVEGQKKGRDEAK